MKLIYQNIGTLNVKGRSCAVITCISNISLDLCGCFEVLKGDLNP